MWQIPSRLDTCGVKDDAGKKGQKCCFVESSRS